MSEENETRLLHRLRELVKRWSFVANEMTDQSESGGLVHAIDELDTLIRQEVDEPADVRLAKAVVELWDEQAKRPEPNRDAAQFLKDVRSLQRHYRIALSHEDTHGAFEIRPWTEELDRWIGQALVVPPMSEV